MTDDLNTPTPAPGGPEPTPPTEPSEPPIEDDPETSPIPPEA